MLYVNYTSIKINTNQNPAISNNSCVDLTAFGNEYWMMDDLCDNWCLKSPSKQPDFFPDIIGSNHVQNEKQRIHRMQD